MNIFTVEYDDNFNIDWDLSGRVLDNMRTVKMITETAQILFSALRINGWSGHGYKLTHEKHPSVRYTASGKEAFSNVLTHGRALYQEYKARFNNKLHKAGELIEHIGVLYDSGKLDQYLSDTKVNYVDYMAIPDGYKHPDPVLSYRRFYSNKNNLRYPADKLPTWVGLYRFNSIAVTII